MTPIQTPNPYGGHVWGCIDAQGGTFQNTDQRFLFVTSSAFADEYGGASGPTISQAKSG